MNDEKKVTEEIKESDIKETDIKEPDKKNWYDVFGKYGIYGMAIIFFINFLFRDLLLMININGSLYYIFGIYIIILLLTIFNKNMNSLINIKRHNQFIVLIIIPLVLILLLSFVVFMFANNISYFFINGKIPFRNFYNNEVINLLCLLFIAISLLIYIIFNFAEKALDKQSKLLEKNVKIYVDNNEIECKKLYDSINQIHRKVYQESDIAYTATCIPVKYDSERNSLTFCLVSNESHKKCKWMFPGGHVDISKIKLENDMILSDISGMPINIIIAKIKKEAGIDNIKFINNNFCTNSDNIPSNVFSNYCYPVVAPAFNYIFRVNESAKCRELYGHKYHYDFTYVGVYEVAGLESKYDYVEIEFLYDQFTFAKQANKDNGIEKISTEIRKKINEHLKKKQKNYQIQHVNDLVLNSIQEMIYSTLEVYKTYLDKQNINI